ncbi:hypothetical protein HOY80DRAFT_1140343 [Tuber brumale]|nr:hypothetical protein HOY80DRAFT_1140343 [Tuber brumale]
MPMGYWTWRFGSLVDWMCAERPGDWEKERSRRVFIVLEGFAIGGGRESLLRMWLTVGWEFKSQHEAVAKVDAEEWASDAGAAM